MLQQASQGDLVLPHFLPVEVVRWLPPDSVVLVLREQASAPEETAQAWMLRRGIVVEQVRVEPPRPEECWWQVALDPGGLRRVRWWSGAPVTEAMLRAFKRFSKPFVTEKSTPAQEQTLRARATANRPSAVLYHSLLLYLEGTRRLGGRSDVSSPLLRECIWCRKPFPPRNSRHVACERTECKRYLLRMQQLRAYERNPERYREKARQRMARRRARR
ncbi:MAG: hypothetical protein QN172_08650 [Armatimonadota bacterium]|nr:hypothetical protein [Armatimonadota bacterium]